MHHHTNPIETLVLPESGFAFEVGSLYDRLEGLADARDARGKRYALVVFSISSSGVSIASAGALPDRCT